jgi:kinesin family protein 11
MIELYNEEVTDLLTPSEAKPLHLYQDHQKGLIIPKLEEFPITSVDQAMKKLQLGINRRHIAATKINEHSSRSHCIFTITAHMKELTLEGEEVLKIGKLNLVDLAGSENIGKSGVQENVRLREVSNINTSLFTLGRVINALVVSASHVPYRESKLTRLLQDSLGGHTKTCIVATVNPCQSNLDVTLATLDYVKKAMQIRNKPQVNQVLSKKKLLMDYTQEICTLKNQLQQIAEKDGFYLNYEDYHKLINQQQTHKEELDRMRTNQLSIENELASLRDIYNTTNSTLNLTKDQLNATQNELSQMKINYANILKELEATKLALRKQTHLNEALTANESVLHDTSSSLLSRLETSGQTIKSVNTQLSQSHTQSQSNDELVKHVQSNLQKGTKSMKDQIEGLARFNQIFNQQVKSLVSQYQNSHTDIVSQFDKTLVSEFEKSKELSDKLTGLRGEANSNNDDFTSTSLTKLDSIKLQQVDFCDKLTSSLDTFFSRLAQMLQELSNSTVQTNQVNNNQFEFIINHFTQLKMDQSVKLRQFYAKLETNYMLQVNQLQLHNERLSNTLAMYKNRQVSWKEELMNRISMEIDGAFGEHTKYFEGTVDDCVIDHRSQINRLEGDHSWNVGQLGAFNRATEVKGAYFTRAMQRSKTDIDQSIGQTRSLLHSYDPELLENQTNLKSIALAQSESLQDQICQTNDLITNYQAKTQRFSEEFELTLNDQLNQTQSLKEKISTFTSGTQDSIQNLCKNTEKKISGMSKLVTPAMQSFRDELGLVGKLGTKCELDYKLCNAPELGVEPNFDNVFISRVDRASVLNSII